MENPHLGKWDLQNLFVFFFFFMRSIFENAQNFSWGAPTEGTHTHTHTHTHTDTHKIFLLFLPGNILIQDFIISYLNYCIFSTGFLAFNTMLQKSIFYYIAYNNWFPKYRPVITISYSRILQWLPIRCIIQLMFLCLASRCSLIKYVLSSYHVPVV